MRPATLLRLALAGTRADAMRVTLTALSAALAALTMLAAATVLSIKGGGQEQPPLAYTNALLREAGLRPGVAIALLMLTIPVLGLAAQCSRLGAPERDRRLSALRLAGAAPRQAVLIAAGETAVASALGAAFGLAVYLVGRVVAHRPDPVTKRLPLPTDVLPQWWVLAAICASVPALAGLLAVVTLRRVTFGPFGVVRRVRTKAPGPWPGIVIVLGLAVYPLLGIAIRATKWKVPYELALALLALGAAAALFGLVLGTGWLTAVTGRLMRRASRRPVGLLAGARLAADPWSTARSYTTLLLVVAFGAGVAAMASTFDAAIALDDRVSRLEARITGEPRDALQPDPFYDRAFEILYYAVLAGTIVAAAALLVSIVESIVTRRRSYAALAATGVPRAVLARAALWQTLGPLAVAVPATLAVGAALPLTLYGNPNASAHTVTACDAAGAGCREFTIPEVTAALPVPWTELLWIGGVALLAAIIVTGVALVVLGPSTRASELRAT